MSLVGNLAPDPAMPAQTTLRPGHPNSLALLLTETVPLTFAGKQIQVRGKAQTTKHPTQVQGQLIRSREFVRSKTRQWCHKTQIYLLKINQKLMRSAVQSGILSNP
jgi:hypothetical protein